MDKVIYLNDVKTKKDEDEVETKLHQIDMAQTGIAMLLGQMDMSILDGTIAMQLLVNKILREKEWDAEIFNAYAKKLGAINNISEELH